MGDDLVTSAWAEFKALRQTSELFSITKAIRLV